MKPEANEAHKALEGQETTLGDRPRVRPTVSTGISTWEAVLNELLELRNTELVSSTSVAYDALKNVEHLVLPSWKEHGRALLGDAGLGIEDLRKLGLSPEVIERLYHLLYAFAFGLGEVAKGVIDRLKEEKGRQALLLSISDVYATLVAEALDCQYHNMLGKMFEANREELAALRREKSFFDHRIAAMEVQIELSAAEAQRSNEEKEEALEKCASDVARADAARAKAEKEGEEEREKREESERARVLAVERANFLEGKTEDAVQHAQDLTETLEREREERKEEREQAAKAAKELDVQLTDMTQRAKASANQAKALENRVQETHGRLRREEVERQKCEQALADTQVKLVGAREEAKEEAAQQRAALVTLEAASHIKERTLEKSIRELEAKVTLLTEEVRRALEDAESASAKAAQEEKKREQGIAEMELICAEIAALRAQLRRAEVREADLRLAKDKAEREREEAREEIGKLELELKRGCEERGLATSEVMSLRLLLRREEEAHRKSVAKLQAEVVKELMEREVDALAVRMRDSHERESYQQAIRRLLAQRKAVRAVRLLGKMKQEYYQDDAELQAEIESEIKQLKGVSPEQLRKVTDAYLDEDSPMETPDRKSVV